MPRKPRINSPGLIYHVIARGNRQEQIFFDEQDYRAYLHRISETWEKFPFRLYAHTLMPNHLHLLLEANETPISKFLQIIQQRYAQHFNAKYSKVGHLFQSRYKAIICQEDQYLLELVRYIHLNSVRSGIVKDPIDYPWSSHRSYLATKCEKWLDRDAILAQFSNRREMAKKLYCEFVMAALSDGYRGDLYNLKEQQVLGDDDFLASLPLGESANLIHQSRILSIDVILKVICEEMGVSQNLIKKRSRAHRPSLARGLICLYAVERGHLLGHVANFLNRDITSMSHACSRARQCAQENPAYAELLPRIENKLRFEGSSK